MKIEVSTKRRSPNLHFESTKKIINKKITSLVSAVLEKVIRTKEEVSHILDSRRRRERIDTNKEE